MAEPEELDEDLFADLYDGDDTSAKPAPSAAPVSSNPVAAEPAVAVPYATIEEHEVHPEPAVISNGIESQPEADEPMSHDQRYDDSHANGYDSGGHEESYGPIGIKEDGKMFIGGLNWETTDQSLKDYFSQFGEVIECTVMRDGATGRSRGFGFLTFKDPKTVNIVMVKEHYLDGKIIDPKRAIPREEQERTSKIFVGGVSQEATEKDFREFFMRFGRVIDATLMIDKDTGRPRGFGFVTFDGEAAVDATLAQPLDILGKPIEVKRAQPRGNLNRENEDDKKFNRRGGHDKYNRDNQHQNGNYDGQQSQNQQSNDAAGTAGMSPAMMAQYWQRMQQYFHMMQQQMAANMAAQGQGMANPMAMGQMNPAMMQQMMAMQAMGRGQGMPGGGAPQAQSPGAQAMAGMAGGGGMSPAMLQQMQQMQQMQMQQAGNGGFGGNGSMSPMSASNAAAMGQRPGYTAQEQLAFEQQKYEQQQQHQQRGIMQHQQFGGYGPGGPTSWEGMYDDVPQPNMPPSGPSRGGMQGGGGNYGGGGGGGGRQMSPAQAGGGRGSRAGGSAGPPVQPSQAPANAPTGPKNAGKPGANYRGGGRMGHRGFHPYARNGQ